MRVRERKIRIGFGLWIGCGFSVSTYRLFFPDGPNAVATILLGLAVLAAIVTVVLIRRDRKEGWL